METDSLILRLIVSRSHTHNHETVTSTEEEIIWIINEWHEPKGVRSLTLPHSNKGTQVSSLMKLSRIQISILSLPTLWLPTAGIQNKTICRKAWWQHKTCETLSTGRFTTKRGQWMLRPRAPMLADHNACRQVSWHRVMRMQNVSDTETVLPLNSSIIHLTYQPLKYRTPLPFTRRATRMVLFQTGNLPLTHAKMEENLTLTDMETQRKSSRKWMRTSMWPNSTVFLLRWMDPNESQNV